MHIMEGATLETITRTLPLIKHVQIADHPGRHEPGTGVIDYSRVFAHLDQLGYDGWVGAEYKPTSTTTEGLGWMSRLSG